ncbi:hypothetical protein [Cohnella laeviribosi]|uniref:hypothetical protein n=1 Tax=Cohnella laeviribosi TaxID=380174 RepID=UPI0003770D10|nr:hypothetical protein [Cohnella laeviribosi]
MLDRLESDYDCSNAGEDLHRLKQELAQFDAENGRNLSPEAAEIRNRLENQIRFIQNKCDIR